MDNKQRPCTTSQVQRARNGLPRHGENANGAAASLRMHSLICTNGARSGCCMFVTVLSSASEFDAGHDCGMGKRELKKEERPR